MKLLLLTAGFLALTTQKMCNGANNKALPAGYYKGRLEIKGVCFNYTIALLEGSIDTSLIVPAWTNEENGKSYTNVFGLAAPCGFPATINEGDSFYFRIDPAPKGDCDVCMAYYPTPPKKLAIKVVEAPGKGTDDR